MNILRRLAQKRLEKRVERNWEPFRFPEVFRNPEAVTVFCGQGPAGTWPGIYLACSLQKHYRNASHHLVLHESQAETASTLPWEPVVHTYSASPGQLSAPVPQGSILFSASAGSEGLAEAVLSLAPALSAGPEGCDAANVRLRVNAGRFPDRVYGMCHALGITPDMKWRPSVPGRLVESASRILAPVSHRALPYILATSHAADILERRKAELPLRLVLLDGKNRDVPEDVTQGVLMAVVSGASAVIADRDPVWTVANALGVPVVGCDRKGVFQPWGKPPSKGETGLMEDWAELLRRGW